MKVIRKLLALIVLPVWIVSTINASPLGNAIGADYAYLDALFKHFHANPELSMQEFNTSDRLAAESSIQAGVEAMTLAALDLLHSP